MKYIFLINSGHGDHGDSVLYLTPNIYREIDIKWRENLNRVLDEREYERDI